MDSPQQSQVLELVEKARVLLDRIAANGQPGAASDAIQELQQVVVYLRQIHPPQPFQKPVLTTHFRHVDS
jgi:hypothetical protein